MNKLLKAKSQYKKSSRTLIKRTPLSENKARRDKLIQKDGSIFINNIYK